MFFESWSDLGRVLVVGICAYAALIVMLRVSGKRTLAKMNAFDFVVTVALGSTLATIVLSKDVALAEGLLALALLIGLQWVVAWLAVRVTAWRKLIKSEPRLLAWRGELNEAALREERMSPEEVYTAVRASGHASLAEVEAVVLETDGSVSVVGSSPDDSKPSALQSVRGFPSGG
ncbi:MAG: DUF421 domain-containing protein [Chthoniobacterales bacterium]|nr:DUF421 domain-containing protein [Chthoniobacterales bacterium]